MRILQVHNFYQRPGGEDIVVASEEKLLTRNGHDVWQLSAHNDSIRDMSKLQVARQTLWNADTHRSIRQKIQKHGIDIVHAHNTFPLISPAVYYAAQAERVPVVQTLHNYRLICPAATFYRAGTQCEECLGKQFAWPAVVHRCYRGEMAASLVTAIMLAGHRTAGTYTSKVDMYIAQSQFSMDKFVQGGLPRSLITMKPNFVMEDPGIGSGHGGYALYAGRLAAEKGVHTLLAAWSKSEIPICLKIAGDGPLRAEVESLAKINSRVEYLGQCSRAHVNELMRNAELLVFPSEWYECSPLSVLEAMACGTPVLAADQGSISELIVPGQNGFLFSTDDPAGNVNPLLESLEKLFARPNYLNSLRYSTRQYYETHFAPGPNYKSLLSIYERVLNFKIG